MFFVFGISNKEKELDFAQAIICPSCDAYGRLEVYMTYTYLSIFFIPIFRWNKKYYARTTCCGSLYTIDKELGKDIERGNINKIDESELQPININYNKQDYCPNCNSPIESGFDYCPRCGIRL